MTKHLHEKARRLLEADPIDRVPRAFEDLWLGYDNATTILDRMESIMRMPAGPGRSCLLIWGPSQNGKTSIVQEFLKRHKPQPRPDEDADQIPVVTVDAPPKADIRRFWCDILSYLNADYLPTAPPGALAVEAVRQLKVLGVKMLIIDEFHNVNPNARRDIQRAFLVEIKNLSNLLKIPIVATGTDEAKTVLESDKQLAGRFRFSHLPKWPFNDDYRRLLATFEFMIPLPEPSKLSSTALSHKIHGYTDGVLGYTSRLLYTAAELAVKKGRNCINDEILDAAGRMQDQ